LGWHNALALGEQGIGVHPGHDVVMGHQPKAVFAQAGGCGGSGYVVVSSGMMQMLYRKTG
jgi:hypothetical protein